MHILGTTVMRASERWLPTKTHKAVHAALGGCTAHRDALPNSSRRVIARARGAAALHFLPIALLLAAKRALHPIQTRTTPTRVELGRASLGCWWLWHWAAILAACRTWKMSAEMASYPDSASASSYENSGKTVYSACSAAQHGPMSAPRHEHPCGVLAQRAGRCSAQSLFPSGSRR
jgi:hypothetical protein